MYVKVQVQNSLEIESGPNAFDKSRFTMTFLTILGVKEILCSFRLGLEGKTGKVTPDSPRLEFLEKFLASNFISSDAKDSTYMPMKRYSRFTLLRILSAICQKPWEPSFWEVLDFLVLLAYTSLAAQRNLLQLLLSGPSFVLDSVDLFCCYKWKT